MGMRYRRSIKVAPSLKLNVTKTGIGATVGTRGAHYSVHSSGRRTSTVGLPGTGLYYQQSTVAGAHRTAAARTAGGMTQSQALRQHERHVKKVQLAEERRSRPLQKLREAYAAGKIPENKFLDLEERDTDVTLDFMIFGRAPAVKLAERYVLGAISQAEFEHVRNEIIGTCEAEKRSIVDNFKAAIDAVNEFTKTCRAQKADKVCSYCGKKQGLFSPMHKVLDFQLCGACKKQFTALLNYPGQQGQYYTAASTVLSPDVKNDLSLNINSEYVLEYR